MRLICILGILITSFCFAKDEKNLRNNQNAMIGKRSLPASFPVTLGQCSDSKSQANAKASLREAIRTGEMTYTLFVNGDEMGARPLDGSGNANDTFQVRCYRCGMGQAVGVVNQSFCNSQYGFWDISKEDTKTKCK